MMKKKRNNRQHLLGNFDMNRTLFLLLLLPVMAFGTHNNDVKAKKTIHASSDFIRSLVQSNDDARNGNKVTWRVTGASGATPLSPRSLSQMCCALGVQTRSLIGSRWEIGSKGLPKRNAFRFDRSETMQRLNNGGYRDLQDLLDGEDHPVKLLGIKFDSDSDGSSTEGGGSTEEEFEV